MRRLLVATLVTATLAASSAGATTIHVPADQPTIQAGLALAAPGDTVLVACGTYYESQLTVPESVVLRSEGGTPDCATIDGSTIGPVLEFSGYTGQKVSGFTITGGQAVLGGGIYCNHSDPVIEDVAIVDNLATYAGGGIYCYEASPRLTRVVLAGNTSLARGGALVCELSSSPTLTNVTMYGNSAMWGGALWTYFFSVPDLTNCLVVFNSGDHCGGIWCEEASAVPTLACTDVFGNVPNDYGNAMVDQTGINGNISEDPLLCDPDNGNFMLDAMSPCAPDNNDCGVLIGAYPVGCGASPVEATSWSRVKAMYR